MSESDEEASIEVELPRETLVAERYRIVRKLGEGGMGVVYLAEHVHIQKRVALKVLAQRLSQHPQYADSMLKEARTAARVQHEHVVDITDSGRTPAGLVFFVMQHLEGRSLADEIFSAGAMPLRRVLHIARQIFAGVEAAHELDVIHRDLKPDNIFLVSQSGKTDFVKILDFGLATVRAEGERRGTGSGNAVGTPEYMSPEQARAEPPERSFDLYALACVLYEMLTGSPPFQAVAAIDVLLKQIGEAPTPPSLRAPEQEIPPELDAVLLRALAKDRKQRYPTVAALAHAFEAAAASVAEPASEAAVTLERAPTLAQPASATREDSSAATLPPRSRARATGLIALGLLVLAGGAAAVLRSDAWQARIAHEHLATQLAHGALLGGAEGSAVESLKLARARFPGRPEWSRTGFLLEQALLAEAQRAFAAHKLDRARALLDEARALAPEDPAVHRLSQLVARGLFARGNGMVPVEDFYVDRYEYPNLEGRPPMTRVDWSAAAELCRGVGKRLCTETEWERACAGPAGAAFPYGASYAERRCVTHRSVPAGPAPAGASTTCESADGVRDLSGNVAEWTSGVFRASAPQMAVRGGSWADPPGRVGCKSRDYFLPGLGGAPTIGFRCCY